MVAEKREKLCLADGREVWRYTFVRYRDAANGKFIPNQELGEDPAPGLGSRAVPDLDQIEDQVLSTLLEISAIPKLAVKSSASMKMHIGLVDKLKRELAANQEEEWFILGRQLAKEVLALLEEEVSG